MLHHVSTEATYYNVARTSLVSLLTDRQWLRTSSGRDKVNKTRPKHIQVQLTKFILKKIRFAIQNHMSIIAGNKSLKQHQTLLWSTSTFGCQSCATQTPSVSGSSEGHTLPVVNRGRSVEGICTLSKQEFVSKRHPHSMDGSSAGRTHPRYKSSWSKYAPSVDRIPKNVQRTRTHSVTNRSIVQSV